MNLSPLGFGCAPVMGKIGRRDSLRAMALAFELGVTHFDVARSYGFGRAEAVLGQFAAGRRTRITITTKFGVVPPALGLNKRLAMPLARALARHAPALQARLRRESGRLLSEQRFDAAYARDALHTSLTQLATDHVDCFLVHEPPSLPAAQFDEIVDTMQALVREGKARCWGIAYREPADHAHYARCGHAVLQAEGHLGTAAAWPARLSDRPQRIVTRPFAGGARAPGGAAVQRRLQALVAASSSADAVRQRLALAPLALARALAGANGSVVCGMFSESSIRSNVAAIERLAALPAAERVYFDGLLAAARDGSSTSSGLPGASP